MLQETVNKVDVAYLKKLYLEEQLPVKDIRELFGCGHGTFYRLLHKLNMPTRGHGLVSRKRFSEWVKTRLKTPEAIKKMAKTKQGTRLDLEHKKRISEGLKKSYQEGRKKGFEKGFAAWNKRLKGVRFSLKTEFKKGSIPWNKGKENIYSEETKNLIRKARMKQVFPIKDTTIELKIQDFLKQSGLSFFTHQYINIKHDYQCDIFIPSLNAVIECDGMYWHKYPEGREIDHVRTKEMIEKGFKVLRLWENEIKSMNLIEFKKALENEVICEHEVWVGNPARKLRNVEL